MYRIIGADQKEYGPVAAGQIREWLAQGRLTLDTLIKSEGDIGWRPLRTLPEFRVATPTGGVPPMAAAPTTSSNGLEKVIPYKNAYALIGYYLAVFSLLPLIGALLGLVALALGILGLHFRRRNPTAGGTVHAWIAIILGGLCGFGYLAIIITLVSAALMNTH
ncbi:MAG: DUF4339 domain-containing protein [Verrucomicrobiae bacterium]|nr:DUF4339 domain-containing protein [Verrucomicrobiae bacterium]